MQKQKSRPFYESVEFERAFAHPISLIAICLVFAISFYYVYATRISPEWEYLGFAFVPYGIFEFATATILIGITTFFMPRSIDRPSALILFMMFTTVFIPAIIITLAVKDDALTDYGGILVAMAVSMGAAGFFTQSFQSRTPFGFGKLPDDQFTGIVLFAWTLSSLILIVRYGPTMSFVGLDDIYIQRLSIDREVAAIGYVRVYYTNVFSPTLVALGLIRRQHWLVVVGIAGAVIAYMIDAQKAALLIPVLVVLLHYSIESRIRILQSYVLLVGLLTILTLAVLVFGSTPSGQFLTSYFAIRGLAVPALTISQYYDLFSMYGFTWWSNITGISSVVPAPPAFADDPNWPALGEIVGDHYYRFVGLVNVNANPFAGEGAAAAGAFGVLVVGAFFAVWLRILDWAASGWNASFVLLALLPVASALTNAHLSTVLLSFGGAFWTLFLFFYRSNATGRIDRS